MNYHRLVIAFHVCELIEFGYFDFVGSTRFQRSHIGFGCEIHIVTYGKGIAFYKIFGWRFYTVAFVSRI